MVTMTTGAITCDCVLIAIVTCAHLCGSRVTRSRVRMSCRLIGFATFDSPVYCVYLYELPVYCVYLYELPVSLSHL